MRNNITRDIQSTEAAPKYSHIPMEYNSLYPPAFFLHYDMKVGDCALSCFIITQSICARAVHLSPLYNRKIGVQALQKSDGNYLLSEICVFL